MIGIRKRMALSFIFIVVLTVILLEALLINIVRQNYYKNLENNLFSQIKVSADIYNKYFSDATLNDNVLNNVDSFWKQTDAQVEIIDISGKVLMDSIGILPKDDAVSDDVKEALEVGKGSWMGRVEYDDASVIAVSIPLKSKDTNVGVLRFITSLREVDKDMTSIFNIFIVIGVFVTIISTITGVLISNTIVGPLKSITRVAEKMAAGNFNTRTTKVFNDEIGKLSDTLNYMAKEIVKKDRLKNDFISSISHELRTPLTSIKGWAVTLAESGAEDPTMLKDGLEIIEKESDRLTAMVEELLDFSRFISEKVTIKEEAVDLNEILTHIYKQLQPRAEIEGVEFRLDLETQLPIIRSDENRLKQVFLNILDNAFKFTSAGGRIVFSAAYGNGKVMIRITDNGCGIASEELLYVKEKFYKGKNSRAGNGIGLSICDEIIKLLNGNFEITSRQGAGTEVVIILPAADGGISGRTDTSGGNLE